MKVSSFARHLCAALLVIALFGAAYVYRNAIVWAAGYVHWPHDSKVMKGILRQDLQANDFKILATGLDVPWAIGFLPDGSLLVTERPGTLLHLPADGKPVSIPVPGVKAEVDSLKALDENGLLGLAVHPDFAKNGWIYLYLTYGDAGDLKNRVDRYRLDGDALTDRTTILQDIPGGIWGNGGALAFGPDGRLYVGTGDANDTTFPQDLRSLGGKILRVNDDGTIPSDNPFGSAVWSYGHRNPEGLVWDGQGRLWETERGRGANMNHDELNLISRGKNYGWPSNEGDAQGSNTVAPVVESGKDEIWSVAGIAAANGKVFFGAMRGEALYQANVDAMPVAVKAHFDSEYGRIRAVAFGPDHQLYFTTSNTDGRGLPKPGDDQLIRVNPRLFQ